jgi:hypothetical protein
MNGTQVDAVDRKIPTSSPKIAAEITDRVTEKNDLLNHIFLQKELTKQFFKTIFEIYILNFIKICKIYAILQIHL